MSRNDSEFVSEVWRAPLDWRSSYKRTHQNNPRKGKGNGMEWNFKVLPPHPRQNSCFWGSPEKPSSNSLKLLYWVLKWIDLMRQLCWMMIPDEGMKNLKKCLFWSGDINDSYASLTGTIFFVLVTGTPWVGLKQKLGRSESYWLLLPLNPEGYHPFQESGMEPKETSLPIDLHLSSRSEVNCDWSVGGGEALFDWKDKGGCLRCDKACSLSFDLNWDLWKPWNSVDSKAPILATKGPTVLDIIECNCWKSVRSSEGDLF